MKTILKRLLASLPLSATAQGIEGEPTATEIITYAESSGVLNYEVNRYDEITITGLTDKTVTELVIPSEVNGLPVTGIMEAAFENCTSLKKITLPSTLNVIAETAFTGCNKLTIVAEPNSIAAQFAADNGIAFEEVVVPYTLGDIDDNGEINAADAILALQHYAGINILDDISAADVDLNGSIEANDAILILQKYAGIITQF